KRYFSLGVGGSLTCSRAYGRLRSTESKHAVQADHAFFDERILEQSSGFVYVRRRPLLVLGRWLVGPYEATQLLDQWRERLGDTALERFDRVGTARGPGDDLVGERVGVLAPRGRQLREIDLLERAPQLGHLGVTHRPDRARAMLAGVVVHVAIAVDHHLARAKLESAAAAHRHQGAARQPQRILLWGIQRIDRRRRWLIHLQLTVVWPFWQLAEDVRERRGRQVLLLTWVAHCSCTVCIVRSNCALASSKAFSGALS